MKGARIALCEPARQYPMLSSCRSPLRHCILLHLSLSPPTSLGPAVRLAKALVDGVPCTMQESIFQLSKSICGAVEQVRTLPVERPQIPVSAELNGIVEHLEC